MRKTFHTEAKPIFEPSTNGRAASHAKRTRYDQSVSRHSSASITDLSEILIQLLRQTVLAIPKALAFLRQQFFPKSDVAGALTISLPMIKLAALAAVAVVAVKSDLRLHVSMDGKKNKESLWKDPRDAEAKRPAAEALSVAWKEKAALPNNPFAPVSAAMLNDAEARTYVQRYAKIAIEEMHQFGIPASVSMAQALVESRSGNSVLSQKNNNHFGIKCFSRNCKKGHCANFTDDHHKDFFRKFQSPWQSWREHSKMLANGRYANLQRFGHDYKSWARGLKEAGYASDPNYHEKLMDIIEKFKLYEMDKG